MSQHKWYIHLFGEAVGPVSTDSVKGMLKQARLRFSDYIWRDGFTKWVRVSEVDDFAREMPPHPAIPIPDGSSVGTHRQASAPEFEKPVPKEERPTKFREVPWDESPKKQRKMQVVPESEMPLEEAAVLPPVPSRTPSGQSTKAVPVGPSGAKTVPVGPKPVPAVNQKAKAPANSVADPESWPKVRKFIRIPISGYVEIKTHGQYEVSNIAERGLFVKAREPLSVGTEISFRFHSTAFDKPWDLTGVVIRQGDFDGVIGFAIELTRLNPVHKRAISDYIQNQSKKRASGE